MLVVGWIIGNIVYYNNDNGYIRVVIWRLVIMIVMRIKI